MRRRQQQLTHFLWITSANYGIHFTSWYHRDGSYSERSLPNAMGHVPCGLRCCCLAVISSDSTSILLINPVSRDRTGIFTRRTMANSTRADDVRFNRVSLIEISRRNFVNRCLLLRPSSLACAERTGVDGERARRPTHQQQQQQKPSSSFGSN